MPFKTVRPVLDLAVRGLCVRPYPNHPRGCPNFRKKPGCPPGAPRFDRVFDAERVVVVWHVFDLAAHVGRMRRRHPTWTRRQLECCLYWQGTARKALRAEVAAALMRHPGKHVLSCPEATGVDVTATMRRVGVWLEWPPVKKTVQVALLVHPLRERKG